nr:hypothetical protein [Tanacetum cinerariifolium]
MAMSLMRQLHDTICGDVIGPRRSLLYGAYGCILATLFRSVQDVTKVALEPGTVLGTLSMNGHAIFVLFDTGATHYVICPLRFDDKIRFANLLPLEMRDFDISLDYMYLVHLYLLPKSLPELFVTSHGGTMAMSLMRQWHDTICGGVIGLRRSVWMYHSGKLTNVKRQVATLKSKVEGLEQKIDTLKNNLNDTKSQRDLSFAEDKENLDS